MITEKKNTCFLEKQKICLLREQLSNFCAFFRPFGNKIVALSINATVQIKVHLYFKM